MNIITLNGETFSPDIVAEIDFNNSIVACTLESNSDFIKNINNRIYLVNNKNDILFNNLKLSQSNGEFIVEYNPHIRWCIPKGIDIIFTEIKKTKQIFKKIFVNYLEYDTEAYSHDLVNLSFTIHIDKDRSKEYSTKISKFENLFEININYGPFNEVGIEYFYILQNNYVFQEFKQHFGT